jgi:hypothetical protein
LKIKINTNYTNMYIKLKHTFMVLRPIYNELLTHRFEREIQGFNVLQEF